MAKKRKFVAYRRIERPYTRKSKYRAKSFVRATPNSRVVRFVMGDAKKEFPFRVKVLAKADLQIRHNAIESARQSANRHMEKKLGKNTYRFRIRIFPHHILRENPLASGAGADRMSTGMKKSFGKSISVAARVFKGDTICEVDCLESQIPIVKRACDRIRCKLPCSCAIQVEKMAA